MPFKARGRSGVGRVLVPNPASELLSLSSQHSPPNGRLRGRILTHNPTPSRDWAASNMGTHSWALGGLVSLDWDELGAKFSNAPNDLPYLHWHPVPPSSAVPGSISAASGVLPPGQRTHLGPDPPGRALGSLGPWLSRWRRSRRPEGASRTVLGAGHWSGRAASGRRLGATWLPPLLCY